MSTSQVVPVRIDNKGRVMIPKEVREELHLNPGDTLFLQRDGAVLRYTKAENPFDGLAQHAERLHGEGKLRNLRDFAKERGFKLDGE